MTMLNATLAAPRRPAIDRATKGITASTSLYTKQSTIALDGKAIGRTYACIDPTTGGYVYRAESFRVPGFWCGQDLWTGDGPSGYFTDPEKAIEAVVADHIQWTPCVLYLDRLPLDCDRAESAIIGGFYLAARLSDGRTSFSVRWLSDMQTGSYGMPLMDRFTSSFEEAKRLAGSCAAALVVAGVQWSAVDAEPVIARWLEGARLPRRTIW